MRQWIILAALCCFLLLGCASAPEPSPKKETPTPLGSGPDRSLDPGKRGPYGVGVTTLRLKDESRVDKDGNARPIVIEVWYPIAKEKQATKAGVFDIMKDAPPATQAKLREVLKEGETITIRDEGTRDAPPLTGQGKYPLVLFSHGSGGVRFQSVFQMTHLASHGYVVASADHEGNTLYNLIAEEDSRNPTTMLQSTVHRPQDVKFVYKTLQARTKDKNSRFFELIDTNTVGVAGHSFGGMTTIMMTLHLFEEGVVKAIAPQTPHTTLTAAQGVTATHLRQVPIMVLASRKDRTLDYDKEQYSFYKRVSQPGYTRADRYMVTLNRGGHFNFSDVCELDLASLAGRLRLGDSVASLLKDGCGKENIDPALGHKLINLYNTAFFNLYLRGDRKASKWLKPTAGDEIAFEKTLYAP